MYKNLINLLFIVRIAVILKFQNNSQNKNFLLKKKYFKNSTLNFLLFINRQIHKRNQNYKKLGCQLKAKYL